METYLVKDAWKLLVDALINISRQHLESEMPEEDAESADFNEGYDSIVRVARRALELANINWRED